MRLVQLARKLDLKPTQIADFIENEINGEKLQSPNALIAENDLEKIIAHFSPIEKTVVTLETKAQENVEQTIVHASSSPSSEAIEVIRAPKIEVEGVKVVGKIELPEKPSKEQETESEESTTRETIHTPSKKKQNQRHRTKKTVSYQEKEKKAALQYQKKVDLLKAQEKKKKKAHYEKMMADRKQTNVPKNKNKAKTINTSEANTATKNQHKEEERPTSVWKKFIYWLNH